MERTEIAVARRRLSGKRAETVRRLCAAAEAVIRRVDYREVTLPMIAAEAGISRATAYIYFSSKEHLIAEVYRRRVMGRELDIPDPTDVVERVVAILRSLVLIVGDEPRLSFAISQSLLSADPDARELRVEISRDLHGALVDALAGAGDMDPVTLVLLELVYTGAMVHGGTGQVSFAALADTVEAAARRILARSFAQR